MMFILENLVIILSFSLMACFTCISTVLVSEKKKRQKLRKQQQ